MQSFRSICLFVQEEKRKIDFQDGNRCHFILPIGTILAIFLSTSHPDVSYRVSGQLAFRFREEAEKNKF